MNIWITGRRTGKTETQMAILKRNPNALLLVIGYQERKRLVEDYGKTEAQRDDFARRIVTTDEVMRGSLRGMNRDTVVNIDNLDIVLRQLIGYDIGFTTTTEG